VVIDHVAMLVADAEEAGRGLRDRCGLGLERSAYLPLAGTWMHTVWLDPPQFLELHTIEDRVVAAGTESGRRVLACERDGGGLFAWAVLVDDLEAVSARLGVEILDYTTPHPDGTLRGWRAVSGPPHLPFFIDYPRNGDRAGRIRSRYAASGHLSAPTGFTGLTIGGSRAELDEWLGPNELPLDVVEGERRGIRAARIATAWGEISVT
jgi:catechol 2,3-dioxygenase-like lactoylglutathione lyase family enzyme